jgi:flagellar hook-length control protein FliK
LLETEREFRILEEKMKRVESSLSKRGIKLEETTVKQPSPSGKPEQEQELELIS